MKDNGSVTGIVMVIIFAAGIFLGYYFGTAGGSMESMMGGEPVVKDGSVSANVPESGITIDASGLSDAQKKMLESVGIDPNNITLTPEMVACAEAKVGSARLLEIQNGSAPSMSEGASLAACYN